MKVISGRLKGRNIFGYDIEGTRPTMDRVKESVFASIQNYIKDSIVLDLFSGSGQLGIEALSNGASICYFIDNNKEVIKVLEKNISNLNIKDKSIVLNYDYKKSLNYFYDNNIKFDLIFIDPPYDYNVYEKIMNKIDEYDLLSDKGIVIIEYSKYRLNKNYGSLNLFKEKKYGNKYVNMYRK